VTQTRLATSGEQAAALAKAIGFPVVVEVASTEITHKSDVGGVRLGLRGAEAVRAAVEALGANALRHGVPVTGFLVEEMAPPGVEVVVGGLMDPRFGPVLMVGLGGVFVEVFADTAFRVCPIDELDARDMIDELRAAPLLRGARGREPVSEDALVAALLAVGGADGLLLAMGDSLGELDINPLIASAHAAVACDARIVLRVADREER
jgi:acetate---CoA ligase (ADP-forming) subunit beta